MVHVRGEHETWVKIPQIDNEKRISSCTLVTSITSISLSYILEEIGDTYFDVSSLLTLSDKKIKYQKIFPLKKKLWNELFIFFTLSYLEQFKLRTCWSSFKTQCSTLIKILSVTSFSIQQCFSQRHFHSILAVLWTSISSFQIQSNHLTEWIAKKSNNRYCHKKNIIFPV